MRCFLQWDGLVDLIQHQRLYSSQSPGVLLLQELWTRTKHCNAFDGANFMGKSHRMYASAAFFITVTSSGFSTSLHFLLSCHYLLPALINPTFSRQCRWNPVSPILPHTSVNTVEIQYMQSILPSGWRTPEILNNEIVYGCSHKDAATKSANCRLYLMFWWMA